MNSHLRDNAEFWKKSCEDTPNKLTEQRAWQKNIRNIVNQVI